MTRRNDLLSRFETAWRYQPNAIRDILRAVIAAHYPTVVRADEESVNVCTVDGGQYPCATIRLIETALGKL